MNLFTIDNNKLSYTPEALAVKEFKALWDRDKSKTKDIAVEELSYVYHMADYKSDFKAYDKDIMPEKIIEAVITTTKWKPDALIEAAITRYKELQETPSMGILRDAEIAIAKIREYFRNIDVSDDETGKATTALINNVKALGDLIKGMNVLKEIVSKEMNDGIKLKGQGILSSREKPKR